MRADMKVITFTTNWKRAAKELSQLHRDEYLPIKNVLNGTTYEVGQFSRYDQEFDDHYLDKFLCVNTKDFSERTSFFSNFVFMTGIGLFITFRGNLQYVLYPGKDWRLCVVAQFGTTLYQHMQATKKTRLVEGLINEENRNERNKLLTSEMKLRAAIEEAKNLEADLRLAEQEIRHLRNEISRHPQKEMSNTRPNSSPALLVRRGRPAPVAAGRPAPRPAPRLANNPSQG